MTEPSELVGVVERRLDFLERLTAGPLRKHELVDALGHSRSTVNRAIDELEAAGLVAGETDGYRTTLSGRLLASEYREFLTVADDLAAASDVLDPLGADVDVDPAILRGAETYRAAAPDPYRPLEVLDEALADADAVAAALPAFPYPRLAERLRRAAAGGGTVDLALADRAYRHAADRFADDLGAVARRDGCRVAAVDAVDAGVVAADGTALLLTFDDDGTLRGAAASTEPEALAWAETEVRDLIERGRDADEALAAMDRSETKRTGGDRAEGKGSGGRTGDGDGDASDRAGRDGGADGRGSSAAGGLFGRIGSGGGGRSALSAQGFHAVDEERLSGDPDPYGPLRATASFPEVDAGYVLDRTTVCGGDRRSIAGLLVDGLAEGTDHALVGPPGSGKSTVCRSVAVEWHRSGRGPVTYRPGDGGDPFSATERLRERVTGGDGHHLVVVENVVDPGAAAAFGVARELADRDDVSFLFDAREEPYDDPDGLPLSPADLRYRREVTTARMPRLDGREVERFVDHVADCTGAAPAADPAALLDDVRRADDERVGELLALVHRLVRATGDGATGNGEAGESAGGASGTGADASDAPAGRDDAGPESGLEAAVAEAVREVRNRPPPTADVAVLVNLLNVAGVSDVRTLAYALVDGPDGSAGSETGAAGTDGEGADRDPSPTVDGVRRALDRLVGTALVRSGDGEYRAVHDEWSVLFLERLVEREPAPVVARRVGRAVSRVLALADDPASCSRIRRAVGGDAPTVDRIERDPGAWAAETVRAVYGVGRRYPRLAPLYGRVRYAWIDLPDACPDDLRDRPPEWVARMYVEAGDLDGATAALDAWRPVDEAGDAERQRGYGDVARRRGEYDAARERYERAEELFAAAGDRGGLVAAVRGRAQAAHFDGDYEIAYEAASRAYAIAARAGDPIAKAKALMDVGNALDGLDGTDAVLDHYRVAGDLFRAYDDTHGAANVRANQAVALRRRGDLDAAERTARRALDGYRTVGDEHREAISLLNLSAVAEQRGAVGEAIARAAEARTIAERIGSDMYEAFALSHLGSAAHLAGDLDRAERFLTDALDGLDRLGADTRCAMVTAILGEVAVDRGDLPEAGRRIERTASLLDDHAGRKRLAELDRIRGRLALARGDAEAAAAALTDAVDAARAGGFTQVEAQALASLGAAAAERGDALAAAERLTAALDLGRRIEDAWATASAADRLADLLSGSAAGAEPIDSEALTEALLGTPPEAVPAESAADSAAYREIADRWRVDGDGVAAAYPALG
ncbi:MarR family transcriptional regulator [Halorubrum sp. Atlit-26R]|uniref:transcriptional regulator FilR1 domain-containing protein n=1 Tax=Halorubrum sp. Atlit-26R TaxID=2282128 RepID=UPI000EF2559F|nr:MarR family transcriptional regulator [Halorubrum sp. Atlit-26R]RLM72707.1 transcriptional regulator [Halorubrum sp. Atlit-26R]